MITIIFAVLPVFAIIVAGFALSRTGLLSSEFWQDAGKLVYWVLFPAFLFHKTSTIQLGQLNGAGFVLTLVGAFLVCVAVVMRMKRPLEADGPATTSLLQGASRHNTFIALAVAERLFGEQGLALAAIATAVLVPFTNLTVITIMTSLLSSRGESGLGKNVLRELLRNPFIVSILCGISLNLAGIGEIPVLTDVSAIVGRAALPIVLLCIGASLQLREMGPTLPRVYVASGIKLLVFPLLVVTGIALLPLTPLEGLILMIYAAVPTSSAAYALARQMGGDAVLMANIITFQTLIALLTLPLTLWLTARWLDFPI